MIQRVTRNKVMPEEDCLANSGTLNLSRLSYSLLYLTLLELDFTKPDELIQTTYKTALKLPSYTANICIEF